MSKRNDRFNKVTIHLRDTRNKVVLEKLAQAKGVSLSEYTAYVLEVYYLPQILKKLSNDKLS